MIGVTRLCGPGLYVTAPHGQGQLRGIHSYPLRIRSIAYSSALYNFSAF